MNEDWKIQIVTGPLDQDSLIAEIFFQGEDWGVLTDFGEKLTIYKKEDGQPWVVRTEEVIDIIDMAKKRIAI